MGRGQHGPNADGQTWVHDYVQKSGGREALPQLGFLSPCGELPERVESRPGNSRRPRLRRRLNPLVTQGARGWGGPVPAPLPAGLPPPGPGGRCPLAATWPRPPPEPRPHAGACALASPSSRLDLVPAAQGRLTCAVRGAGRGSRAGQTRRPGTRRSVRRARGGGPACACARVETGGSRRGCGVPTRGPPCAGLRPGDPGPGQILGVTVRAWRPPRGHGRRPALSPLSGPRVRTGGGSEPSSRPPCCAGKTSGCGRRGVPTPGWVWPGQVHLLRPPGRPGGPLRSSPGQPEAAVPVRCGGLGSRASLPWRGPPLGTRNVVFCSKIPRGYLPFAGAIVRL